MAIPQVNERPLWAHQKEGAIRGGEAPYFAYFWEPGCGKSRATIEALRTKFRQADHLLRTIIFCPPIVIQNWVNEWQMYSHVEPQLVVPLVGSSKQREARLLEYGFSEDKDGQRNRTPRIFLVNYQTLALMPKVLDLFALWQPEAVVFDESHKVKSHKSQTSKAAAALVNQLSIKRPIVYLLSGTPVLNSPMDLFQQFLIMDGGKTFGKNFYAFQRNFFWDKNASMPRGRHFPDWRLRPGMEEVINKAISTVGMRVKKEDCLDLPPLVQQTIKVGMTSEQARLYKEMKQDFVTYIDDQTVSADLAITKALRLQQIASGYCKTTDGEEISLDKTPKMEALTDLLEEITPNAKVLVWATWKENYAQIRAVCDQLGLPYVEVHGGISAKEKDEAVRRFNTDPLVRVFIGHPGSGGIGINLVVASYSIFFSRTFSLEHSLQAEARNHRGGSREQGHERITRIDLVCENSIDELVQIRLAQKIEIGEKLLQDLSMELGKQ